MRRTRNDEAGAEVVGAIILFAIFTASIAVLNVTAVPNAGLAAEEDHYEQVLAALNGLQSDAEGADRVGATAATAIELAPERTIGQDFFSFFLATPARATGELTFEPDHGDLRVFHHKGSSGTDIYDLGSASEALPLGRLTFDPHPVFRGAGAIQLENGGTLATSGDDATMRFDPPISVSVSGDTTTVTIQARVLNGTGVSMGGSAPVRVALRTEAAALASAATNNARDLTFRLETDHGPAWGAFLNETSEAADLAGDLLYDVDVAMGTGGAPDVVTWTLEGTESDNSNDIRLTTGIAVYQLTVS